jgi:hypothetical protein
MGTQPNMWDSNFPTTGHSPEIEFAVLRIFGEEMSEEWSAGFYRFDEGIIRKR